MRLFISEKKARKAGIRACSKGPIKFFKVEPHYQFNKDRTVDVGYRVALFKTPGVVCGWVRE